MKGIKIRKEGRVSRKEGRKGIKKGRKGIKGGREDTNEGWVGGYFGRKKERGASFFPFFESVPVRRE